MNITLCLLKNIHQYFVSFFSIGKVFLHTFSPVTLRTLLGISISVVFVLCLRSSEVRDVSATPGI